MLYTPQAATSPTTMTVGIYTIDIPMGSSSPDSGPLFATWAIDTTLTQTLRALVLPLTINDTTGDPTTEVIAWSMGGSGLIASFEDAGTISGTNISLQLPNLSTAGSYTIMVTVTNAGYTATAYFTLTVAAVGPATDPPEVTNGQFSTWVYPPTVTMPLNSSVKVAAGFYDNPHTLIPLIFTVGPLPDGVYVTPGPFNIFNYFFFSIYTSDNTPSGTFTIPVTATWNANPSGPPPSNSTFTATFNLTLILNPDYVPPVLDFLTPVKGRSYGVIGGRARSGYRLHRFSQPIQSRKPAQLMARHIFRASKLAWKSYGPMGRNNAPTAGVDPQSAWLALGITYNGIETPGKFIGNVQAQSTFGPCASPEAFQVMCQTMRTNLGLDPLPTPPTTETQNSWVGGSTPQTFSGYTLTMTQTDAPPYGPAYVSAALTLSHAGNTLPTPPAPVPSGAYSLFGTTDAITINLGDTREVDFTLSTPPTGDTLVPLTFSTLPDGLTAFLIGGTVAGYNAIGIACDTSTAPGNYTLTVTATVNGYTPTWSITIVVYDPAANPFQLSIPSPPTGVVVTLDKTTLDLAHDPYADTTTGTALMSISSEGLTGSTGYTADATLTYSSTPYTIGANFSTAPINRTSARTCPYFVLWLKARAALSLGPGYVPFGIVLTATPVSATPISNQIPDGKVPFIYQVTASDLYTSGQGRPALNKWAVILYTQNGFMINTDVLDAWQAAYGLLDASGYIAFLINTIDPATGTVSPGITCTVHYEAGTTKSIDYATSTCPFFAVSIGNQSVYGLPGDTVTTCPLVGGGTEPLVLFETDSNGQSGPATYTATQGYDPTTHSYAALPSWLSVTFGTPTQTAPSPYLQATNTWYTPYTVTLGSAAPFGVYLVMLTGTQPSQTARARLTVTIA